MNGAVIVDVAVVLIVLSLAAYGYRSGLLKSASSLAGLAVGMAIAVPLATLIARPIESAAWRLAAVVGLLVSIANCGYIGGSLIGDRLRARVQRRSSRGLDQSAGGVLSAVIGVVLVWMLAVPFAASPLPGVAQAVRGSAILPKVDAVMPNAARTLYDAIAAAIRKQGLPDVIGPLQQTDVNAVGPPDAAVSGDPEVVAASRSVVKVVGQATQCGRVIDGSGWVYAPQRIATNAHVVAGTSSVRVEIAGNSLDASVVYSDESLDIAILKVPGLKAKPLPYAAVIEPTGADVVVVGHPGGGPLTLSPAKVRAQGTISGPTFREDSVVSREVLTLRGKVIQGNSGGPLIDLDGRVVGVVFGASIDQPDVGYALTIGAVQDELNAGVSASAKVRTGACYP